MTRKHSLRVRLTEDEKSRLQYAAEQRGVSMSEFISPLTSCRRFNGSPLPTFKIEYWLEEDTEDFKNHSFRYKDECHLSRYIYL